MNQGVTDKTCRDAQLARIYEAVKEFVLLENQSQLVDICKGGRTNGGRAYYEKVVQEKLHAHLTGKFEFELFVKMESVKASRRVDISVENVCCIELKHYTVNQRNVEIGLFGEMEKDFWKARDLPLIQIGILTAIENLSCAGKALFDEHPLIRNYVCKLSLAKENYWDDKLDSLLKQWDKIPYICRNYFRGRDECFDVGLFRVAGRVNYFIGVSDVVPSQSIS